MQKGARRFPGDLEEVHRSGKKKRGRSGGSGVRAVRVGGEVSVLWGKRNAGGEGKSPENKSKRDRSAEGKFGQWGKENRENLARSDDRNLSTGRDNPPKRSGERAEEKPERRGNVLRSVPWMLQDPRMAGKICTSRKRLRGKGIVTVAGDSVSRHG